jgi:hypothetical protein
VIKRQSFGPGDLSHIARRLLSVAGPADRDQPIKVVCVLRISAQGEGRTVIEDEETQSHPSTTIETSPALPKHDLGAQNLG